MNTKQSVIVGLVEAKAVYFAVSRCAATHSSSAHGGQCASRVPWFCPPPEPSSVSKESLQPLTGVNRAFWEEKEGRSGEELVFARCLWRAETGIGCSVRKLPNRGAEQKWCIFSVNEFPGIGIIQQILHSFIAFFRAKASALLMHSSARKPPSLLFVVHCFASSYTVFHITRKQTNSSSSMWFFPLADNLQKRETLPPALGYGVSFSNGAFLFLFVVVVVCWLVLLGFFCCVCHFLIYFVL